MRRTQIYVDDDQDERLAKRASAQGVTKSALIRRAIDEYLDGPDEANDLNRFRAALEEIKKHPISLPAGKRYVEALRRNDVRGQRELERRWRG